MSAPLWVYLDDRRVGYVEPVGASLRFKYDEGAPALSVRLPPRTAPYEDAECRPFFANLLPEGGLRLSLCRQLRIAPEDDFALLAAIGTDCAGAVSVRSEESWKPDSAKYVRTTEAELRKWVKNPAARPSVRVTP